MFSRIAPLTLTLSRKGRGNLPPPVLLAVALLTPPGFATIRPFTSIASEQT
jgi:hypothetical protein